MILGAISIEKAFPLYQISVAREGCGNGLEFFAIFFFI